MQIDETNNKSLNDSSHLNGDLNEDHNELSKTEPNQPHDTNNNNNNNNNNVEEKEHIKTVNANGIRSNLIHYEN